MKRINKAQLVLTIIALMGIVNLFSQKKVIITDTDFEKEIKKNTYFPLSPSEKKITWKNTFYIQKIGGTKIINEKEYTICTEEWESGRKKVKYLREEDGVIYLYEVCCETETVLIDEKYKIGKTWERADKITEYKVVTLTGKLKTPYANYNNLFVISKKKRRNTYKIFYKKGFGYIGSTRNGALISHVIPVSNPK